MKKVFHMTKEGVNELESEKAKLLQRRIETAEAIKVAREMGDLAENAEYQSAKQEQEKNDARIDEIEYILANVELIKIAHGKKVGLGSTVTLEHAKGGKELVFQVVGTIEADPIAQKISDESPIGKALLGKKEGDEVEINTPVETKTYKIAAIH
jgi:transcription elongation factor GreA